MGHKVRLDKWAFQDQGNVKWYPVARIQERGVPRGADPWPRYLWFKLERTRTHSVKHAVAAFNRYKMGKKKKGFLNTRREDDTELNHLHLSDPKAIQFRDDPPAHCDTKGDHWNNLNNEYYLCRAQVYAMLDKAQALSALPQFRGSAAAADINNLIRTAVNDLRVTSGQSSTRRQTAGPATVSSAGAKRDAPTLRQTTGPATVRSPGANVRYTPYPPVHRR
jgi:hypothetical protein